VLSELLGINPNTIGQVIAETRQLLNEHHHTILPTRLRFTTTAALMLFVFGGEPEPLRLRVSEQLAHPAFDCQAPGLMEAGFSRSGGLLGEVLGCV
jgi:hypothetical protein